MCTAFMHVCVYVCVYTTWENLPRIVHFLTNEEMYLDAVNHSLNDGVQF